MLVYVLAILCFLVSCNKNFVDGKREFFFDNAILIEPDLAFRKNYKIELFDKNISNLPCMLGNNLLKSLLPGVLKTLWQCNLLKAERAFNCLTPKYLEGCLFVVNPENGFVVMDCLTGKLIKKISRVEIGAFINKSLKNQGEVTGALTEIPSNPMASGGGITWDQQHIYCIVDAKYIIALDKKNYEIKWVYVSDVYLNGDLLYMNNYLYTVTCHNELLALQTNLNKPIVDKAWKIAHLPIVSLIPGYAAPQKIDDGHLLVSWLNGDLGFFDLKNKQNLKTVPVNSMLYTDIKLNFAQIYGQVLFLDGDYLALGNNNSLRRIGKEGQTKWEVKFGGMSTPAQGKNAIFAVNTEGVLVALDKLSGKIIWARSLKKVCEQSSYLGVRLVGKSLMAFGSEGAVVILDPIGGHCLGTQNFGISMLCLPLLVEYANLFMLIANGKNGEVRACVFKEGK